MIMFVEIVMGFVFLKKDLKNSLIFPYTWMSSAANIKYKQCWRKVLEDFGNWRKNITMVFELMISLWTEICSNFVTFNLHVALEYYCNFKKCIKFHMPSCQYWIRKNHLRKNILKNNCYPLYFRLLWWIAIDISIGDNDSFEKKESTETSQLIQEVSKKSKNFENFEKFWKKWFTVFFIMQSAFSFFFISQTLSSLSNQTFTFIPIRRLKEVADICSPVLANVWNNK